MAVRVVIRYNPLAEKLASSIAKMFEGPDVEVLLERAGDVESVVIIGPMFATTDVTKATALLRRYLLAQRR